MITLHRGTYINNVLRLSANRRPTLRELVKVCPHITDIDKALYMLVEDREHAIAIPGVKVHGAYWRLTWSPKGLGFSCCRTPYSYIRGGERVREAGPSYPFMEEALAYAEDAWGSSLIFDESVAAAWFLLQDPEQPQPGPRFGCRTVFRAGALLAQTPHDMYQADDPNKAFSKAIMRISAAPMERLELRSDRANTIRNCARCGHWLDADNCPGCKREFPYASNPVRARLFLPKQFLTVARAVGHPFESDPRLWH